MDQLQTVSSSPDGLDWECVRPLLDEAMCGLADGDRDALLLRFFKNQDFRAVGLALGVSDDAAQKRVSRALEKLRDLLSRKGITTAASALSAAISANAVETAPDGFVAVVCAAAAPVGTVVSVSSAIATTKTIAMTTLQKTLVTATLAVLAGGGLYEARQAAQFRDQIQTLQQQQAALAEQIRQLQSERDKATNRLAGLRAEEATRWLKARSYATDLLRLRAEVTRLGTLKQEKMRKAEEPSYRGRTLTAWLEASKDLLRMEASDTPEDRQRKNAGLQETYDAVQNMGTNAVPELLQWVANTTNGPGNSLAALCIQQLGSDAKIAVPGLIAILDSGDEMARYSALNVLQRLGAAADEALPAILDHVQNDPSQSMRSFALTTLANCGIGSSEPDKVVPVLVECLASYNEAIDRPDTLRALAGLGVKAQMAVPVILPYLDDANQEVRIAATNALLQIEPAVPAQPSQN